MSLEVTLAGRLDVSIKILPETGYCSAVASMDSMASSPVIHVKMMSDAETSSSIEVTALLLPFGRRASCSTARSDVRL